MTLKQLLIIDALTCLIAGVALLLIPEMLADLVGLSQSFVFNAGVLLLPCAAAMWLASRKLEPLLVWTMIFGNFAWAAASVLVAFTYELTTLGQALVLAQAVAVAGLGALEWRARGGGESRGQRHPVQ